MNSSSWHANIEVLGAASDTHSPVQRFDERRHESTQLRDGIYADDLALIVHESETVSVGRVFAQVLLP